MNSSLRYAYVEAIHFLNIFNKLCSILLWTRCSAGYNWRSNSGVTASCIPIHTAVFTSFVFCSILESFPFILRQPYPWFIFNSIQLCNERYKIQFELHFPRLHNNYKLFNGLKYKFSLFFGLYLHLSSSFKSAVHLGDAV